MKKAITMTNKGLQYLYILTGQILSKNIATVRKTNKIFAAIEPAVIAFETKGQELMQKGKEIQQLTQFANEKHNQAIQSNAYETDEARNAASEKIEQGKKDLEEISGQLKALDSEKATVSFERETFTFLELQMKNVLASLKTQDGAEGICGRKDLLLIEEVFDALENPSDV